MGEIKKIRHECLWKICVKVTGFLENLVTVVAFGEAA